MLHGGRLGNVREDIAKFTSSRKDDARLADAVLAINKAHVVMLMEQKIIQWQDGSKILSALQKQDSQKLDPNAEDVHMAVEEAVLATAGPEVGGNLHIAKSRNDQVTTAIRMALRVELLNIMQQVIDMQESLLCNRQQTHQNRHLSLHSPTTSPTRHLRTLFALSCQWVRTRHAKITKRL